MEVTTIDRVGIVGGTALPIVENIDSFRLRARRSFVELWASVRAAKPLVDTEGAVGGLASTITHELVDLQKRVRDLRATLCKNSMSAGLNLFVAASQSGKCRRDQVTPKSGTDSDAVFRKGSSPTMFSQGLLEMVEHLPCTALDEGPRH